MRSEWVKLNPAFNLVKFPLAVSKERSVPTETQLFPTTPEKLTRGFAVNPMLVLMPAYSCWYCSSTCYNNNKEHVMSSWNLQKGMANIATTHCLSQGVENIGISNKRLNEEIKEVSITLPDLWSGTMKLNIVFKPGAGSSTVTVVKSCRNKTKEKPQWDNI